MDDDCAEEPLEGCLVPSAVRRQSLHVAGPKHRASVGAAALAAAFVASSKAAVAKRRESEQSTLVRKRGSSSVSIPSFAASNKRASLTEELPDETDEVCEEDAMKEPASGSVMGVLMVVLAAKRFKDRAQQSRRFRWDISGIDIEKFTYGMYFESPTFNLGPADHNSGGCCVHFWPNWDDHCYCAKLIVHGGLCLSCRIAVDGRSKVGKTMQTDSGSAILVAFFRHEPDTEKVFSNVDVEVLSDAPAAIEVEPGRRESIVVSPCALATARSVGIQVDIGKTESRPVEELSELQDKLRVAEESLCADKAELLSANSTNIALETANAELRSALGDSSGPFRQTLALNFSAEELLGRRVQVAEMSRDEAVSELLVMEARAVELAALLQAERRDRITDQAATAGERDARMEASEAHRAQATNLRNQCAQLQTHLAEATTTGAVKAKLATELQERLEVTTRASDEVALELAESRQLAGRAKAAEAEAQSESSKLSAEATEFRAEFLQARSEYEGEFLHKYRLQGALDEESKEVATMQAALRTYAEEAVEMQQQRRELPRPVEDILPDALTGLHGPLSTAGGGSEILGHTADGVDGAVAHSDVNPAESNDWPLLLQQAREEAVEEAMGQWEQKCTLLEKQNQQLKSFADVREEESVRLRGDVKAWADWGQGIIHLQDKLLKEKGTRHQQEVVHALLEERLQQTKFAEELEGRQVTKLAEDLRSCEYLAAEQGRQLRSVKRLADEIRHRPRFPPALTSTCKSPGAEGSNLSAHGGSPSRSFSTLSPNYRTDGEMRAALGLDKQKRRG